MIEGRCQTNLDRAKQKKWPTVFCAVPSVDDCIRAEGGMELRVVRITHTASESRSPATPFIIVELGLPVGMSIADFEGRR